MFQRFFEQVGECCIDAQLVWGQELYFDGTQIRAHAAMDGMKPRWYWQAQQAVQALFAAESPLPAPPTAEATPSQPAPAAKIESAAHPR